MVGTTMLAALFSLMTSTWPSIADPLPRAGGGENDVAIVVAASDYVFLPDIDGATDNADDWYTWLARVRGVPLERLTILKDREVTRERIERALTSAASTSKPGGTVWFVFIGHGAPGPGGDDGVLLGVDTQADIDSLGARGVSQSFVTRTLNGGKQQQSVVVFDACFSGKAPDGDAPLVPGMQATVPVRRLPPSTSAPSSKTAVLAASETFAGPLPGASRPAFSYALLGAVRGWGDVDGDHRVTIDEAYRSARRTLQIAYKSDARLPKLTGDGSAVIANGVTEAAPDFTSVAVHRVPSTTTTAPPPTSTKTWTVPTTM
ncbi:MAG TPA: caspase family protein, partial [Myxococcota bacterium]